MKKSELLKRIKLLESRQKVIKEDIQKFEEDVFYSYFGFWGLAKQKNPIPTKTKIEKILDHLGIEIYETASEIKVRSTYKPKKKKSK